jgi:hypothetical protein
MADRPNDNDRDPDESGRLGRLIRLRAEQIRRAEPEPDEDNKDMPPPTAREKLARFGKAAPGDVDD